MSNLAKKLGKRLQEIRKIRNLTQSQLAELVNLEIMTISRIENGVQYPKPENIEKFAKVLNINVRELYDFCHFESKKDLIKELCDLMKVSSVKDLQFYKKIIMSHLEYKK